MESIRSGRECREQPDPWSQISVLCLPNMPSFPFSWLPSLQSQSLTFLSLSVRTPALVVHAHTLVIINNCRWKRGTSVFSSSLLNFGSILGCTCVCRWLLGPHVYILKNPLHPRIAFQIVSLFTLRSNTSFPVCVSTLMIISLYVLLI